MAYVKDPADLLDYLVDWAAWLGEGEVIATTAWTVESGLTSTALPDTHDDTTATIWLGEGDDGEDYEVSCKITTNQSRVVERSFTVQVRNR